jgi:hypothetical protein
MAPNIYICIHSFSYLAKVRRRRVSKYLVTQMRVEQKFHIPCHDMFRVFSNIFRPNVSKFRSISKQKVPQWISRCLARISAIYRHKSSKSPICHNPALQATVEPLTASQPCSSSPRRATDRITTLFFTPPGSTLPHPPPRLLPYHSSPSSSTLLLPHRPTTSASATQAGLQDSP